MTSTPVVAVTSLRKAYQDFNISFQVHMARREPEFVRAFDSPFKRFVARQIAGPVIYRYLYTTYEARDGDQVLGHMAVQWKRHSGCMHDIVVNPNYRRRGVSEALVDHFFQEATQRKYRYVFAGITTGNTPVLLLINHLIRTGRYPIQRLPFSSIKVPEQWQPDSTELDSVVLNRVPTRAFRRIVPSWAATEMAGAEIGLAAFLADDVLPLILQWVSDAWAWSANGHIAGYILAERMPERVLVHAYSRPESWGTAVEASAVVRALQALARSNPGKQLSIFTGNDQHHNALSASLPTGFAEDRAERYIFIGRPSLETRPIG